MFRANIKLIFIMKKLANLKGVKTLNRIEQKSINGGDPPCSYHVCQNWHNLIFQPDCHCD